MSLFPELARPVTMAKVYDGPRNDSWASPKEVFDALHAEFGFTLDAAADDSDHLCERYFTAKDDGLRQDWSMETVWCNPPYSEAAEWIRKGHQESLNGAVVVMLLPVRTGNKSWHSHIHGIAEIRWVRGRLSFGDGNGRAPFDSAIVIWRPSLFSDQGVMGRQG